MATEIQEAPLEAKIETKNNINYPSSNLIYLTIKEEYNYELQRIQKIDSKVNIGITFCSALFFFILNLFNFNDLILKLNKDITLKLAFDFYFAIWLIMTLSYIGSFILLLIIIRSRKYYRININELFEKNLHKTPIQVTEMFVAGRCKDSVNTNREINNNRMKIFNISLVLIFVVIICSVILSTIKYNFFWKEE